ncbi:hypothetical protein A2348_02355 [Candidatus Uhrbacteria bacterium RIFOXYB12_FULL_58_10]|uniref:Aminoglycoside phosphotransferase domain-containing protein n=1 Tax=Candidatus Uhrbacteria bacterium RIFOXYB2_FULL_57_15 TaxID=1802422 RepID=A0A1F7W9Y3_9BACT|nr:MAG: hypothetical protein A2348_02355 [Candidatus Uhrbacteria bacterium RIFOXYB12_FULL_58_10]OGL99081.1 MAG: hypothetical protein A2501_02910 [Candidatus Uhrbacteria bacterium RIFOXYC12_FULL_57_11]OGL99612.1 MAG: hypothetical protein A2304_04390 [Candidatus Uhrbacteria bacterium RIFOXYB2_FULL_57_15]
MANEHDFGNRITANAAQADDGKDLIVRALKDIEAQYGYTPIDESSLFAGVYYDSKKIGSLIIRVQNGNGGTAVLKLQLRSLPFDEGFIIRSLEKELKTDRVHPVKILHDNPWSKNRGFGYLIFEDISHLPNLWKNTPTMQEDRVLHKEFISALNDSVLPIKQPWIEKPSSDLNEKILEAFKHFRNIAHDSSHHHIADVELEPFTQKYFEIIEKQGFDGGIIFTHGHLSGYDVKHDQQNNQFILMANLYWSWRPENYELVFPIWVDLMQIRDTSLTFSSFLDRVMTWVEIWPEEVAKDRNFWLMLLERSMLTIMLDLGASEWKDDEIEQKRALLESWKTFFNWLVENKLS